MAESGKIDSSPEWSFFAKSKNGGNFFSWPDLLAVIIVAIFGFYLWHKSRGLPGYEWNWRLLTEFVIRKTESGKLEAGLLLQGLFTTLRVGFWTLLFSLFTGFLVGCVACRKSAVFALIYNICINLVRNTPPLVILFCVYFFAGNLIPVSAIGNAIRQLPMAMQDFIAIIFATPDQLDRMFAAILALGVYQAAYVAEIVRGAILSINSAQWDAARALGFSHSQSLLLVILPQALIQMIPALTGQAITTFKDSALASLISLPDLTFQSLEIMAISSMTFEIWISTAIIYLCLCGLCAMAGAWFEKSYSRKF